MYFPQDEIPRRVDERNAMADEGENHIVPRQHEENNIAEVPDAINEVEIEMVEIDAPQQVVPQVVEIVRRVDERNAMAGLAEGENPTVIPRQHKESDAEIPIAINEREIEMIEIVDAPQQVPQDVQNAVGNDEPQFGMADEHQVPQLQEDNAAGNAPPVELAANDPAVEPVANDPPPVEPVVNDPPPFQQEHAAHMFIRPCSVSIPRVRTAPVYQPYPFRSPRHAGPQQRKVRVKCAVCRHIFRMNNVPFDFNVEGNVCSKECALFR